MSGVRVPPPLLANCVASSCTRRLSLQSARAWAISVAQLPCQPVAPLRIRSHAFRVLRCCAWRCAPCRALRPSRPFRLPSVPSREPASMWPQSGHRVGLLSWEEMPVSVHRQRDGLSAASLAAPPWDVRRSSPATRRRCAAAQWKSVNLAFVVGVGQEVALLPLDVFLGICLSPRPATPCGPRPDHPAASGPGSIRAAG